MCIRDREEGPSAAQRVLDGIRDMITTRRAQPAFHPEAAQVCHTVDDRLFVLTRKAANQELLCVFNLSAETVTFSKDDVGIGPVPESCFLQGTLEDQGDRLSLSPYASVWLVQSGLLTAS